MDKISFFFSYASRDYQRAWRIDDNTGQRFNLIDRFLAHLCNVVAGRLGLHEDQVAFRDKGRIEVGELWADSLTDGLQASTTLIALISPYYLQSENCGREFRFMLDRFELLKQRKGGKVGFHRIIPVYWESTIDCREHWPDGVQNVVDEIQFKTDQAMPENYPATGLRQLMLLSSVAERERLCEALADRIKDHFHKDEFPNHPVPKPFTELPSMFTREQLKVTPLVVGKGPGVTQVVYVVACKDEMAEAGCPNADHYPERREEWEPFHDARGATVEAVMQEAIRGLGNTSYRSWGWPDNLLKLIREAKKNNSIVVLVLDRWALRVQSYKQTMSEYSETNLLNTGLVTAGGVELENAVVGEVFDSKFYDEHRHHEWRVFSDRDEFVECVRRIVGGIKSDLMKRGERPTGFRSTLQPVLMVPVGAAS